MDLPSFLKDCDAAANVAGVSRSRLSTILFGSGVTLDRLHSGKTVTVRVLQRATDRLDRWSRDAVIDQKRV